MCWRMFAGRKRDWPSRQRQREVYDGGGRAEVLVRLLLCGGSTLRYRVVADKVWRRSAMRCICLGTRRRSRDGHVTGERECSTAVAVE